MRLSSHDASFLYTETASGPMHGIAITELDGEASFQQIYDYHAARIHLVPRLRQKLAFVPFNVAHPVWVDDPNFNLDNHIKPVRLPVGSTTEDAVQKALELGESLLPRDRPLWLTYVLEGVAGKTVLAQMSHHAFVDGATAVAMAIAMTDAAPDAPEPAPEATPWQPAPEPKPMDLWREAMSENSSSVTERVRAGFSQAMAGVQSFGETAALMTRLARPVMQAPWNAGNVGPKRTLATLNYRFDEFRPIRAALGGTVNDIVVSVVVEGAARYMKGLGEQLDGRQLRLMCPVNVRAEGDDPLAGGGNRVSAMFPLLSAEPMAIKDRYQAVREELDGIKARKEPETLDAMQGNQPDVPPVAMAATLGVGTAWDPTALAARWPQPVLPSVGGVRPPLFGFNFTCTNVPGPTDVRYVAGLRVSAGYGTMMLGGTLGLGVGVNSFSGNMIFGFTADPRLLPDVSSFAACVAEAFAELKTAAGG